MGRTNMKSTLAECCPRTQGAEKAVHMKIKSHAVLLFAMSEQALVASDQGVVAEGPALMVHATKQVGPPSHEDDEKCKEQKA